MRLEIDWRNRVVDLFVKRDRGCPYPFLIANPDTQQIEEAHEGLSFENFKDFVMLVSREWTQIVEKEGN